MRRRCGGGAAECAHLLEAGEPIVANVNLHERAKLAQPGERRDLIVLEGKLGELLQPVQALERRVEEEVSVEVAEVVEVAFVEAEEVEAH